MAESFTNFCKRNGIKHVTGPPYCPKQNGAAENIIKTFKRQLKSMQNKRYSLQHKVDLFLFRYRSTEHTVTKEKPCVLMLKRQMRTRLDLLKPSISDNVNEYQEKQPKNNLKYRKFNKNEHVLIRDYRKNSPSKWQKGVIIEESGPLNYKVKTDNGFIQRRHADQMRKTGENMEITSSERAPLTINYTPPKRAENPRIDIENNQDTPQLAAPDNITTPPVEETVKETSDNQRERRQDKTPRRSSRNKTQTKRYGDSIPWSAIDTK